MKSLELSLELTSQSILGTEEGNSELSKCLVYSKKILIG